MLTGNKLTELIKKYGGSVPRYTSYPTAPEWRQAYDHNILEAAFERSNAKGNDYSLYLHLPFCESQCYFCGCNVVIAKEHGIEQEYLEQLKRELSYIAARIDPQRRVAQMAWGGGTPSYLTPKQIYELYSHISENFTLSTKSQTNNAEISHVLASCYEYSIEIDPRVTTVDHLKVLHELGFNRLSMGVQDFNPTTQEAVNRVQSFDSVISLVEAARNLGFKSINLDLIYGLPFQTLESFTETVKQVIKINPERIALFNFAYLPEVFPFQNKHLDPFSLPGQDDKLKIFSRALETFTDASYVFIGLDHFAKTDDELAIAKSNKTLYRNFQGYTTHYGCDLFGAGITAISDIDGLYKQNHKKLNQYYAQDFAQGENLGTDKFMLCSRDDIERRAIIKDLMCNGQAIIKSQKYSAEIELLQTYVDDGLLSIESAGQADLKLEVTELGRFFVRNIASSFDIYLKSGRKIFSKSL